MSLKGMFLVREPLALGKRISKDSSTVSSESSAAAISSSEPVTESW